MSDAQMLMQQMLQKPLYVALRIPVNLDRLDKLLESHLRWMIEMEEQGRIFASGPFTGEGQAPGTLGGMTIVRADSEREAEALLHTDPFIEEGLYRLEIKKWMLMEGGFSLNISFSNQKYGLV